MAVEARSSNLQSSNYLSLERRRVKFMRNVLGDREHLLYRRHKLVPHLLIRVIESWVISEAELIGRENLDLVRNEKVTIAANHITDIDHGVLEHGLIVNGFSDTADRLLFAAGLKMWDRWQTEWGMWGLSNFPTAAPGYFKDALKLLRSKELSESQRQMIKEEYLPLMRDLNSTSFEAIRKDWEEGKATVVIYPETTRSRNGLMKKGINETSAYFESGLVLPVMMQGAYEVFPAGQQPNWGKILRRDLHSVIRVGEPIKAERLQDPDVRNWLKEMDVTLVDFIMSRIAVLNFDLVDPQYRPLYERLVRGMPEGLLIRSPLKCQAIELSLSS